MSIQLQKVEKNDLKEVHQLQVIAFKHLLEKYQDFDTNPGAETLEKIEYRFSQPFTIYYFIKLDDKNIGAIRVIYHDKEDSIKISPMFIHPDYQGQKLGQEAVSLLEKHYKNVRKWTLDTIWQEKKLCYFYEKLGYLDTGKREKIQDGMDIIFYKKIKNLKIL